MREKIDEKVSIVAYFSAQKQAFMPRMLLWQNKEYHFDKIGYHHKIKVGETLHHIFELADRGESMWFRLNFDTSNLHWTLEIISDGMPS